MSDSLKPIHPHATVYIIVPFFNRKENIPKLFSNLEQQTYPSFKLILVDHGSKPLEPANLPTYVVYLRGSPEQWWSGAVNIGLRYVLSESNATDDDFIMLQNDDVDFGPELIQTLLDVSREKEAIVGAITLERGTNRILDANNFLSFWQARHICPWRGHDLSEIESDFLESDVLKGRGVLYPWNIARQIGYTDEKLHYRADPEWSFRAKKLGYRLGITTQTKVETIIDTQEKNSDKHGLNLLWYVLASKRSTQNIPAAWRYFRHCFGLPKAVYAIILNVLISFRYCLLYTGKRKSSSQSSRKV